MSLLSDKLTNKTTSTNNAKTVESNKQQSIIDRFKNYVSSKATTVVNKVDESLYNTFYPFLKSSKERASSPYSLENNVKDTVNTATAIPASIISATSDTIQKKPVEYDTSKYQETDTGWYSDSKSITQNNSLIDVALNALDPTNEYGVDKGVIDYSKSHSQEAINYYNTHREEKEKANYEYYNSHKFKSFFDLFKNYTPDTPEYWYNHQGNKAGVPGSLNYGVLLRPLEESTGRTVADIYTEVYNKELLDRLKVVTEDYVVAYDVDGNPIMGTRDVFRNASKADQDIAQKSAIAIVEGYIEDAYFSDLYGESTNNIFALTAKGHQDDLNEYIDRTIIKPLNIDLSTDDQWLHGININMFLINNFVSTFENMDYLSTFTKSLMPSTWTSGKYYDATSDYKGLFHESLSRSLDQLRIASGIGYAGRIYFDSDHQTGNRLGDLGANMLTEFLADPLNVIELGASLASLPGKISMNGLIKNDEAFNTLIKNNDWITTAQKNKLIKNAAIQEAIINGDKTALEAAVSTFVINNYKKSDEFVQAAYKDILNSAFQKTLSEATEIAKFKHSLTVIKRWGNIKSGVENFEKIMNDLAGMPVITPIKTMIKLGGSALGSFASNHFKKHATGFYEKYGSVIDNYETFHSYMQKRAEISFKSGEFDRSIFDTILEMEHETVAKEIKIKTLSITNEIEKMLKGEEYDKSILQILQNNIKHNDILSLSEYYTYVEDFLNTNSDIKIDDATRKQLLFLNTIPDNFEHDVRCIKGYRLYTQDIYPKLKDSNLFDQEALLSPRDFYKYAADLHNDAARIYNQYLSEYFQVKYHKILTDLSDTQYYLKAAELINGTKDMSASLFDRAGIKAKTYQTYMNDLLTLKSIDDVTAPKAYNTIFDSLSKVFQRAEDSNIEFVSDQNLVKSYQELYKTVNEVYPPDTFKKEFSAIKKIDLSKASDNDIKIYYQNIKSIQNKVNLDYNDAVRRYIFEDISNPNKAATKAEIDTLLKTQNKLSTLEPERIVHSFDNNSAVITLMSEKYYQNTVKFNSEYATIIKDLYTGNNSYLSAKLHMFKADLNDLGLGDHPIMKALQDDLNSFDTFGKKIQVFDLIQKKVQATFSDKETYIAVMQQFFNSEKISNAEFANGAMPFSMAKNIQAHIDNISLSKKLKQDYTIKLMKSDSIEGMTLRKCVRDLCESDMEYENLLHDLYTKQHLDPQIDTIISEARLTMDNPELANQFKLNKVLYFDSETSGLNTKTANLYSIGTRFAGTRNNGFTGKIQLHKDHLMEIIPSTDLLYKMYGKDKTYDEALALFFKDYCVADDVIETTQRDLIYQFNQWLIDNDVKSIAGMNTANYDSLVFESIIQKERMFEYALDRKTDILSNVEYRYGEIAKSDNFIDIYPLLREANGVYSMKPKDIYKLSQICSYVASLTKGQSDLFYFDQYKLTKTIKRISDNLQALADEGIISKNDDIVKQFLYLSNQSENYLNHTKLGLIDNLVIVDPFKTDVDYNILTKLANQMGCTVSDINDVLMNKTDITPLDLVKLQRGEVDEALQLKINKAYQQVIVGDRLGLGDEMNMQRYLSDIAVENGFDPIDATVNYKINWSPEVADKYVDINRIPDTFDARTELYEHLDSIDTIKNKRIKNLESIYNTNIFKDAEDLKLKTYELVNQFKDNPNSWVASLDLNKIQTEEECLAVYYEIVSSMPQLGTLSEYTTSIRNKAFGEYLDFERNFNNSDLIDLQDQIEAGATLYDKLIKFRTEADNRFGFNTNDFILSQNLRPFKTKVVDPLRKFSDNDKRIISDQFAKTMEKHDFHVKSLRFKNLFMDDEFAINSDAVVSELLNNGGVKRYGNVLEHLVSDRNREFSKEYYVFLSAFDNAKNLAKLEEAGVFVFKDQQGNIYLCLRDIDNNFATTEAKNFITKAFQKDTIDFKYNGKVYKPTVNNITYFTPVATRKFNESALGQYYSEALDTVNDMQKQMWRATHGQYSTFSNTLQTSQFRDFYVQLPKEVREAMGDNTKYLKEYFATTRFDVLDDTPFCFAEKSTPNLLNRLQDNYGKALLTDVSGYAYLDPFFNKDTGFYFKDVIEGSTAEEIINAHADGTSDGLVLCTLTKSNYILPDDVVDAMDQRLYHTNRLHYTVSRLNINSEADIQKAIELDAVYVPYQVYVSITEALDSSKGFSQLAQKAMNLYKLGYLTNLGGTAFRDIYDSGLKTFIESGNITSAFKHVFNSTKVNKAYDDTVKLMGQEDPNFDFRADSISRFFRDHNNLKIDEEQFMFVHKFRESSLGAGQVGSFMLKDMYGQKGVMDVMKTIPNILLKPIEFAEVNARFGLLTSLQEQGYTLSKTLAKIDKAHFNYSAMSPIMRKLQYVIPFANFRVLNFDYWLTKMSDDPMLMRLTMESIQQTWNAAGFTADQYSKNRSMQYAMLHGYVAWNDDIYIKLSPSYLDFYNMLMNPVDTLHENLFAPWQRALKKLYDVLSPGLKGEYEAILSLIAFGTSGNNETDPNAYGYFNYNEEDDLKTTICKATAKFLNEYGDFIPFVQPVYQRYFKPDNPKTKVNEGSTMRKNMERLDENNLEKLLAFIWPDVFGTINKFQTYKWLESLPEKSSYENSDSEKDRAYYKAWEEIYKREDFIAYIEKLKQYDPSELTDYEANQIKRFESPYGPYSSEAQKLYFDRMDAAETDPWHNTPEYAEWLELQQLIDSKVVTRENNPDRYFAILERQAQLNPYGEYSTAFEKEYFTQLEQDYTMDPGYYLSTDSAYELRDYLNKLNDPEALALAERIQQRIFDKNSAYTRGITLEDNYKIINTELGFAIYNWLKDNSYNNNKFSKEDKEIIRDYKELLETPYSSVGQMNYFAWRRSAVYPYSSEKQKNFFEFKRKALEDPWSKTEEYKQYQALINSLPDKDKNPKAYYGAWAELKSLNPYFPYSSKAEKDYYEAKIAQYAAHPMLEDQGLQMSSKQLKFFKWATNPHFPYSSEKQKNYFEGKYSKANYNYYPRSYNYRYNYRFDSDSIFNKAYRSYRKRNTIGVDLGLNIAQLHLGIGVA